MGKIKRGKGIFPVGIRKKFTLSPGFLVFFTKIAQNRAPKLGKRINLAEKSRTLAACVGCTVGEKDYELRKFSLKKQRNIYYVHYLLNEFKKTQYI